jgi:hypothetical protein
MIDRARNRLDEMITESMSRERARFETALGIETDRAQRAEQMREVARHLARTEL